MRKLSGVAAAVAISSALAAVSAADGGTIVAPPAADATVFAAGRAQPRTPFLLVRGRPAARAFLRWQLPNVDGLERVTLQLYALTRAQGLRVHSGSGAWTERSIRSRSPRAARFVGTFGAAKARSWLRLDVTQSARAGGNVSFAISKAGATATRIASREAKAALRPRLVLVVNGVPLCDQGTQSAGEDSPLTGQLSCQDDGALTYRQTAGPAHGTLSVASNGSYTYVPAPNFNGPDEFAYEACDEGRPRRCGGGRVALQVAPVNDAPVAANDSYVTAEDTQLTIASVLANDADPDNAALAAVKMGDPAHGTVGLNPNGSFTYTPAANFHGADSFTYRATDGSLGSNVATVTLAVTPVNDAPAAAPQSVTTTEDTAKTVTLAGTDVDGDALGFAITGQPSHGTLSPLVGGTLIYTPAAAYQGPDSFRFTASDGVLSSAEATVSISVSGVNSAPVALDDSYSLTEDTALTIPAPGVLSNDSDVDHAALTAVKDVDPVHGTVVLNANGSFTYTPAANYNGGDAFTYRASDGSLSSSVATVNLTVTAVNDAPLVNTGGTPIMTSIAEDAAAPPGDSIPAILATGFGGDPITDVDAGALEGVAITAAQATNGSWEFSLNGGATWSPLGSVSNGSARLLAASALTRLRFVPNANFNGTATFTFRAWDQTSGVSGEIASAGLNGNSTAFSSGPPETVTITVTPVNDPPTAAPQSVSTAEDTLKAVTLSATDADADALTFAITTAPTHGTLTGTGASRTYSPSPNYAGPDSFSFTASDGKTASSPAVVSVTVTPVNDAPVLDASGSPHLTPVNANASDPAGDTVGGILASGAGGDPISDVDTGDPHGIAVVAVDSTGGTWHYDPTGSAGWSLLDGVTPGSARLLGPGAKIRFVPVAGFDGGATLDFRAWDQSSGTAGGTANATANGGSTAFSGAAETASIDVLPVGNQGPAVEDDSVTVEEDTAATIDVLENDSDPDGGTLTIVAVTAPEDGTATLEAGMIRYQPEPDQNGSDRFFYTVSDGQGGSATAEVDVMVTPVNDLPVARDDVETVAEDGMVVFDPTGNDVGGPLDESSQPLAVSSITGPPEHGTAEVPATGPDAGRIRYTPSPGYEGTDVLLYEVCETETPDVFCGEAIVDLTVTRVSPTAETAPVPHADANGTDAGDDPAIWVNPANPAQSVVIGTNKFSDASTNGGLLVYDLDGNELQYTNDGRMNNVDLLNGFPLGGDEITIVTATERNGGNLALSPKRIWVYKLDHGTRTLSPIHRAAPIAAAFEPLGTCMYRSPTTGEFFVFVTGSNGMVEQWRLFEATDGSGLVDAAKVRSFDVGEETEGCVADQELGHLYLAEEDVAIWKYSAEPDGGTDRTQVDVTGGGHLAADIEGLSIAYGPAGTGYLFASSQGDSAYAVYRREGGNEFVRRFKIKDGAEIDGASQTDGIDVTSASLGPSFPNGVFVAHDNANTLPAARQDYKLVPLEQIVKTAGLGSNGSCARPYADSSPWNLPIDGGATVDADSAMHVAAITGALSSDPTQYTYPVYETDPDTPLVTVTIDGWFSNVLNGGRTLENQRRGAVQIPIPSGAEAAAGGDAQLIVVNPRTGDEWGLSHAEQDAGGAWTAWNAYHYNTRWGAVPPYDASGKPFFPRGAGVPYLAGLVRPCELARGRIDHALAFAYDFPTAGFVYPATKSDGDSPNAADMPEGSRLQLDPTLTQANLAALNCTGHCLTIARALQRYGMYIIDNSGRPKVMLEYEGTAAWGGSVTSTTASPIPLQAFRLLEP